MFKLPEPPIDLAPDSQGLYLSYSTLSVLFISFDLFYSFFFFTHLVLRKTTRANHCLSAEPEFDGGVLISAEEVQFVDFGFAFPLQCEVTVNTRTK